MGVVYDMISEKTLITKDVDVRKYINEDKAQVKSRLSLKHPYMISLSGYIDVDETKKIALYEHYEMTLKEEV